ncbi:MAG: hypothetical protein WCD86_20200 [Ktedonobacteraceae bacterium]
MPVGQLKLGMHVLRADGRYGVVTREAKSCGCAYTTPDVQSALAQNSINFVKDRRRHRVGMPGRQNI